MYVKNTIRHSLTNNGALLQHCQARQPQVYGSWAAIRYAYRHICPWRAGWHLARLPLTGIKKYTFWIHLEIGKDDQRKKKYFYWLLANFIVILKMLSKKKNRPKSVLFGLFFVQPVKHRIVHVHNVTQADRISVCPFSIYDTLLTRIILCGV